jgi:putative intracellular protease/amidase
VSVATVEADDFDAVGILAFTRGTSSKPLVADRNVTGFPNAWEEDIVDEHDLMPDGRKLPYWVEDEVKAAGGLWDAELDEETSVTVDGDLVTARGPPSSAQAVRTLFEELGIEAR